MTDVRETDPRLHLRATKNRKGQTNTEQIKHQRHGQVASPDSRPEELSNVLPVPDSGSNAASSPPQSPQMWIHQKQTYWSHRGAEKVDSVREFSSVLGRVSTDHVAWG